MCVISDKQKEDVLVDQFNRLISSLLEVSGPILVVTHVQPDGDALGSLLALGSILTSFGKAVRCAVSSPIDTRYHFLPAFSLIESEFVCKANELSQFAMIVVLDCGDLKRVGDDLAIEITRAQSRVSVSLLNIDHHISNDGYGSISFVNPMSSSTCEMVYDIADEIARRTHKSCITQEVATMLLTGIVSDTGGFRYPSTTPKTLRAASALLERGASLADLSNHLFSSTPLAATRLKGHVLSTCDVTDKIALAIVDETSYAITGAEPDDTEGLAEELRGIEGVLIAALLRRDSSLWRVSLRGKDERLNLSSIAAQFGGGGHRLAAAFRSRKSLLEVREPLMEALKAELFRIGASRAPSGE
jgi:bifunctional oligoribonuclease and PAP phosphatase NrnA